MADFQRPRTVSEGVYEYLRQELLSGRLVPGQWLREQELAAALSVSRTPVREAIRQLAQEGLLSIEANRGVRVLELSVGEAMATYQVRERLEGMAAGLAARNITDDGRQQLMLSLHQMLETPISQPAEQIRADNEFHAVIARLSGNPVLCELIERMNDRVMRVKILTRDVNITELARSQHRDIAAAISAGDEDRAEQAMSSHIRINLEIVRERLEQELAHVPRTS
jgi:DNA-binding GntR family transcriptional regulator